MHDDHVFLVSFMYALVVYELDKKLSTFSKKCLTNPTEQDTILHQQLRCPTKEPTMANNCTFCGGDHTELKCPSLEGRMQYTW